MNQCELAKAKTNTFLEGWRGHTNNTHTRIGRGDSNIDMAEKYTGEYTNIHDRSHKKKI